MTLLVPERMLVFSPALAATIGLEEAVLLHQLHDLSVVQAARGQATWFEVEAATLTHLLPFWDRRELQRISKNLIDKGVLRVDSAPLGSADLLRFSFGAEPATQAPRRPLPAKTGSASQLGESWRPSADTLSWLALSHGIAQDFALAQLDDFIFYWRERGEIRYAWDNDFRKHVIAQWQRHAQKTAEKVAEAERPYAPAPDSGWYPSADALQILSRAGISREFIDDAVPEFLLYWRERGGNDGTWNSKFIAHIRRQWAKFEHALEHDTEPRPISPSWQPSEDVYDILRMANIDIAFACELLPEFILFWRDAGTVQRSWNTKFLQHIKYQWATRHHLTGAYSAGSALAAGTAAAAPRNAFERLTDRSWATGLVDGV